MTTSCFLSWTTRSPATSYTASTPRMHRATNGSSYHGLLTSLQYALNSAPYTWSCIHTQWCWWVKASNLRNLNEYSTNLILHFHVVKIKAAEAAISWLLVPSPVIFLEEPTGHQTFIWKNSDRQTSSVPHVCKHSPERNHQPEGTSSTSLDPNKLRSMSSYRFKQVNYIDMYNSMESFHIQGWIK